VETLKRIFTVIFVLMCIPVFLDLFFSSSETATPAQNPPAAISQPAPKPEPAKPVFKPTPAMQAALDPGDGFRRDGWRFEFGELTERGVDVRAYWPVNQRVTESAVEVMGKAMVADAVQRLHDAGFDVQHQPPWLFP